MLPLQLQAPLQYLGATIAVTLALNFAKITYFNKKSFVRHCT